jgi:hypothetical protein
MGDQIYSDYPTTRSVLERHYEEILKHDLREWPAQSLPRLLLDSIARTSDQILRSIRPATTLACVSRSSLNSRVASKEGRNHGRTRRRFTTNATLAPSSSAAASGRSRQPVLDGHIRALLQAANQAPGYNQQSWWFIVVRQKAVCTGTRARHKSQAHQLYRMAALIYQLPYIRGQHGDPSGNRPVERRTG